MDHNEIGVEDLYMEHSQHEYKIPNNCSTCFNEYKAMDKVEKINEGQKSNLSILRQSIERSREEVRIREEEEKHKYLVSQPEKKTKEVPLVTIDSGSEFILERHTQLCNRMNILYYNYLVYKNKLLNTEECFKDFESTIKELSKTYEDLIAEGFKVRF